jgi:catechol 2,3-dioxygenase-like lactoylglutathione lyase family enzyme
MFDQQVTFLYTADLARSAAFYGQTLGLPLALDQSLDQGVGCKIFQVSVDGFLGVCQSAEGRSIAPDGIIVTLVTGDVDGWYERLKARGVALEAPPATKETFNIYHFFLRDPDGYLIEVQRFLDPAWPAPGHKAP